MHLVILAEEPNWVIFNQATTTEVHCQPHESICVPYLYAINVELMGNLNYLKSNVENIRVTIGMLMEPCQ